MVIVKYLGNYGEEFFSIGNNIEECLSDIKEITGEEPNINNCRFFEAEEFFVEYKIIRK